MDCLLKTLVLTQFSPSHPLFTADKPCGTTNTEAQQKSTEVFFRLLNYKKDYLEDCLGTEIEINYETKTIVWKASELLRLTLNQNIRIVETRGLFNPTFPFPSF